MRICNRPKPRWAAGLIVPALLLAAWQAAAVTGFVQPAILPSPVLVITTLVDMARSGEMTRAVGATATRMVFGFLFGAGAATLFGGLCGTSPRGRALLDPLIQALRSVPSLAWVPLFILWLGIFEASKITLVAVGVFFPIYLNLVSGIANVDRKLLEVGRVQGFSALDRLLRTSRRSRSSSNCSGFNCP